MACSGEGPFLSPPHLGPFMEAVQVREINSATGELLEYEREPSLKALDAEGRRHLLIQLQAGEAAHEDRESRGVNVTTRELVLTGQPPRLFIDIAYCDVAGHDAFDLVGGELANRLAIGTALPAEIVARVLAKWRRFWGQLPRQMLSREAQLGLFAELWFLSRWLLPRVGAAEAVARWRGPFGARHDFEWPGGSVEVKANTANP